MQTEMIHYDPSCDRKRWVAYFDLLGSKSLIQNHSAVALFTMYARAIERAKRKLHQHVEIHRGWFSDSFLFYTEDGTGSDYTAFDVFVRWFVHFLVAHDKIPVRGAITFGDFYGDVSHNILFGKALVEAYEYGEAQDWIGFILCPSAVNRLKELGLSCNLNYKTTAIPYCTHKRRPKDVELVLPACAIGKWVLMNGHNRCLASLEEMSSTIADRSIKKKYINSISFLNGTS